MNEHKKEKFRYFVTSATLGDQITWRVVREETGSRGMTTLSFVCGHPTQRAANSVAKALYRYRPSTDVKKTDSIVETNNLQGKLSEKAAHSVLLRPMC